MISNRIWSLLRLGPAPASGRRGNSFPPPLLGDSPGPGRPCPRPGGLKMGISGYPRRGWIRSPERPSREGPQTGSGLAAPTGDRAPARGVDVKPPSAAGLGTGPQGPGLAWQPPGLPAGPGECLGHRVPVPGFPGPCPGGLGGPPRSPGRPAAAPPGVVLHQPLGRAQKGQKRPFMGKTRQKAVFWPNLLKMAIFSCFSLF